MRFFSNEAQENADDKAGDRAAHAPAQPAAVPQQRAGSPWQHDTDPVPQPAAVGMSPVGDAGKVQPPADATAEQEARHHDTEDEAADRTKSEHRDATDPDRIDVALEDRGTFDDPHLAGDKTGDKSEDKTAEKSGDTVKDKAGDHTGDKFDDEFEDTAADHDSRPAGDSEPRLTEAGDRGTDSGTTLPGPGATMPSGPTPFFPSTDTQPLRDRWRDVQLRFVDDPKGATNEAAGLVDEAVDKLSQALRDHRGSLAKGSDDTESLRVELRSYRDILDRLLGL
ncbi:hypothetical protein AB0G04_31735 [Actinoplanes sp. NPDC023801]|uniref:hypothetical protein n=1 Tax=Actinoplanes sp. NPDC023801 TaxID=3154595 RepID=UPI003405334C